MLDLGTSFVASVSRDPKATAIVDGDVRLTYEQWYRAISSVVAGLEAAGLGPGDHLVTLLQNRWEAATLHWACQFAGLVITPINWRVKADELDYCIENAEACAVFYQDISAEAVQGSGLSGKLLRVSVDPGT
ncbi:MAG: AMP-binding protein, partial [Acetobacteraceae bacterium]|nr:AMP-binding protein [Acetobacteraceae bacterium]